MSSPRHTIVAGLSVWRDCALALPRLCALRGVYPDAQITVVASVRAREVLLRLKLANHVEVAEGFSTFRLTLWLWWQRLFSGAQIVTAVALPDQEVPLSWSRLSPDLSFLLPSEPFVILSLPDGLPSVRMAALARKLSVYGYAVVVVGGGDEAARARVRAAAPEVRDLSLGLDAADLPALARAAVAVIGGMDGDTALMALSGARTLIVTDHEDSAGQAVLPHATTRWLVCEKIDQIGINDMIGAIDDWI